MIREISLQTTPKEAAEQLLLAMKVSRAMGVDVNRIKRIDVKKRSVDARQKQIKINLSLIVHLDEVDEHFTLNEYPDIKYRQVTEDSPRAVVVGAGPAGLFAALELLEHGIKPVILERGKDVDSRRKDLALISRTDTVDPDSNYCFGEGGAGTFSDGKLYTRSKKKGNNAKVLAVLNNHGASDNILYEAHPHIGTDKLPDIIKNIRCAIIAHGGEVHFGTKVTGLTISDDSQGNRKVEGVVTADGREFRGPVILATGHSSRDTYEMLNRRGVKMEPKGLAIGVRLEHPQELIDKIQYHMPDGRGRYLPAAEYSLLTRVDQRAVYSFCMCPGGIVVPSASGAGQSAVNGMSPSNRGSRWANSGMVVEVLPEDVEGDDPLKMMAYQQAIEKTFYGAAGGTQKAPAQRMTDFVDGRESTTLEQSSYAPGLISARVDELLPPEISRRLREGFREFGRKKKGFLTPRATVIGAETRTSSPLRLPRDPSTLQHVEIENLYPVGEGAGWAGGIVSSAVDGQNAARALAAKISIEI